MPGSSATLCVMRTMDLQDGATTMLPTLPPTIESYHHLDEGGVVEEGPDQSSCQQQQQPFDIYFYKSDADAALGLGNRHMRLEEGSDSVPITCYTNLDIHTPEGKTLTNQTVVLLETLGEGSFATCYKAEYDGRIVAVKILKPYLHSSKQREAFDRELHALLKTANSPLTLDLIGYRPQPHYWIITSYMNGGTLNSRIKDARQALPLHEVLDVCIQLSTAMHDLHSRYHLLHRDVTPFNLLFHDGLLRLADFGVTLDLDHLGGPHASVPASSPLPSFLLSETPHQQYSGYLSSSQLISHMAASFSNESDDGMALETTNGTDEGLGDDDCVEMGNTDNDLGDDYYDLAYDMSPNGHPYYRAPEVNEGLAYTLAADVYNFGSCLYECLSGIILTTQSPPPSRRQSPAALNSSANSHPDILLADLLWQLQADCWKHDPKARPSFDLIRRRLSALRAAAGSAQP